MKKDPYNKNLDFVNSFDIVDLSNMHGLDESIHNAIGSSKYYNAAGVAPAPRVVIPNVGAGAAPRGISVTQNPTVAPSYNYNRGGGHHGHHGHRNRWNRGGTFFVPSGYPIYNLGYGGLCYYVNDDGSQVQFYCNNWQYF